MSLTAPAHSLEALATRTGVSPRTIRFYQSEGLLPLPERVGREARYGEGHVERLKVIADLRSRGLRLSAIGEVLRRHEEGGGTDDWLGLGEALLRPWVEDRPVLLEVDEVHERMAGLPPDTLAVLERTGVVDRRDDTSPEVFVVPSPGLLDVAVQTARLGLPVEVGSELREVIEDRLRDLAAELVARFTREVGAGHLAAGRPADLATLLAALQPLTRRTVDLLFAHEMERAQRALLDALPDALPDDDDDEETA